MEYFEHFFQNLSFKFRFCFIKLGKVSLEFVSPQGYFLTFGEFIRVVVFGRSVLTFGFFSFLWSKLCVLDTDGVKQKTSLFSVQG